MPNYPLWQVDAFTSVPLEGNPCAVLLDADTISDERMQAVAREMNLSETAFVLRSDKADVRARYFTPAEEIPLAGHPTLSTIYTLVTSGRLPRPDGWSTVRLELQVGVIPVDVLVEAGAVQRVVMSQMKPQFMASYLPSQVMPLYGLKADDALPDAPLQTVSTGTPQLMIPVRSLDVLRRARIQVPDYLRFRGAADFFSVHLFCLAGATAAGRTFARHFGTPPDTAEDPFTGSATGGMAAYLWHYNLIDTPTWQAEQGHWMGRPGVGSVEVIGPRHDIETVKVGGQVVTVLTGTLQLPA